jgi:hypothetical protein
MANDVPHFVLAERNGGRLEVSKVVIKIGNDHLRLSRRRCRGPSVLYVGGAYAEMAGYMVSETGYQSYGRIDMPRVT